ncbi:MULTISPECIES: response regulator [unclassified Bradyrhizobium]|jgi:DNA-binding response OmpR family regulator|uniref:response regulator n=1 Tax=unclassified Bradyrhizobium TaxID=2631580 RepID=UPI001FF8E043|nr:MULTISPECIES: response regulator [unclassified Bradyrhizobium]MCK1522585.1 response regulator [Bradyrhizobium sp. 17]MCK1690141.1 response regulator [Bradyrhizobium sp. 145]
MMVCDMLEELGHKVIAEAGTLKEAIEVARVADFDLAILDLRLVDETTELVAEITPGRGLQFFVLTGHTSDGLLDGFRNAPRLEKPVLCSALAKMIENRARS